VSVAAVLLLAVTATTLPPPQPPPAPRPAVRDVDRTPIRCRPAPYYVSDTSERPRIERILITGSRIPVREVEKRPRPCLLMRTLDTGSHNVARIAD
jgi:hypothetical protein